MFGIIGTAIWGIAYVIGWSKDEQQEQHNRKHSKQLNISYYVDKNGRQRWTNTGKKRTAQEILNEKNERVKLNVEERKKNKLRNIIEKSRNNYNMYVIHKDRVSFEEYLSISLPEKYYDEYEELRKIRDSVSEEKRENMRRNFIYYG